MAGLGARQLITRLCRDHEVMATGTRTYRFAITFEVEPSHSAYDDPEWAADAA